MEIKHFDQSVKINHNTNWSYPPDHPYGILIVGGSGQGKLNTLMSLINQKYIDKIYSYSKYPKESKYQLLSNKKSKSKN